jgi:hypothetical protein
MRDGITCNSLTGQAQIRAQDLYTPNQIHSPAPYFLKRILPELWQVQLEQNETSIGPNWKKDSKMSGAGKRPKLTVANNQMGNPN